jgi:site-specific DNA-adenine methylase
MFTKNWSIPEYSYRREQPMYIKSMLNYTGGKYKILPQIMPHFPSDPPYLLGVATYNENGAWNLTKEIALLEYLDELNTKGVKWALTNVTHHKGMVNEYLIEFAKFYKTIQIDNDYKQCNYQIKETEGETREILVLNY